MPLNFITKRLIFILAVILLGTVFRSYHFSDWLHFELDQARDANVISSAISNGVTSLPLLGPRAQGTYLRLGPAFYYLEYLSAKIFGNDPPGIARTTWLLSILALPVFYLYFQRYFNLKISLALLLLASSSVFLVVYSRFAWNPNLLVFSVVFSLYALLRAVDMNEKRQGFWLIISLAIMSVATQMHFLAFFALPAVFLFFLAIKRPKIQLKFWILALSAALLFYAPVFINETMTGGDNTKEFFKAISKKSAGEEASLPKKLFFNVKEYSAGYFLMLSGRDSNSLLELNLNSLANHLRSCETNCPQDYYLSLVGVLFLVSGFGLLFWKLKKETDVSRRDFLMLNGILFVVCFVLFTPLALEISPRYFLLTAFLPFILLGLIFESIPRKFKLNLILPAVVMAVLLFSNGKELFSRFSELSISVRENMAIETDFILKERTRVTLAQEKAIAGYMLESQKENGYPILFYGETHYVPAIAYILEQSGALFNDRINHDQIYRYANYFWVDFTQPDGKYELGKKENPFYDIVDIKNFGTLTVLKLAPKAEAITDDYKIFEDSEDKSKSSRRYNWDELIPD